MPPSAHAPLDTSLSAHQYARVVPHRSRPAHPGLVAASWLLLTALTGCAAPGPRVAITTPVVEQGEAVWFRVDGLEPSLWGPRFTAGLAGGPGVDPVGATRSFALRADGTANVLETRLSVPDDARIGIYRVVLSTAASDQAGGRLPGGGAPTLRSEGFEVVPVSTKVRNPGAHQGGVEDLTVSAGGTWTFIATGLTPGGRLRAETEDGRPLAGVGQVPGSGGYPLDARGRTIGLTRITLPADQPAGSMRVRFVDPVGGTVIERRLEVVRDAAARVEVVGLDPIRRTLVLKGQGWLTRDRGAGSVIALKIDRGRYRRLPDDPARLPGTGRPPEGGGPIADIWQLIEADAHGRFEVTVRLPTGAAGGPDATEPIFPIGAGPHVLNLLSGQFHPAGPEVDVSRSVSVPDLQF